MDKLIEKVFPNIKNNFVNKDSLCERAIFAPLNSSVNFTNDKILENIPTNGITYNIYRYVDERW